MYCYRKNSKNLSLDFTFILYRLIIASFFIQLSQNFYFKQSLFVPTLFPALPLDPAEPVFPPGRAVHGQL